MTKHKSSFALSLEALESYSYLPRRTHAKVRSFIIKFQQNPDSPGIHREKIQGTKDLYSVRVDRNYRGVMHFWPKGKQYTLLYVANHDDAYDWARRKSLQIDPYTGVLDVVDVVGRTGPGFEGRKALPDPPPGPLRGFQDRDLRRLGISEGHIPWVKGIQDEKDYETKKERLSAQERDAVSMLLAGYSLGEALAELGTQDESTVDTDDFATSLTKPGSQAQFWMVEEEEELKRMLDAPQEKWRVFLHPSQRRLVENHWRGPVRVLGGAGTGKTVVAMHRARWLVEKMDKDDGNDGKVLFLTYTANLATDLQHNLRSLITRERDLARLEVVHLDKWVHRFLKQNDFPQTIIYDLKEKDREQAWDAALEGHEEPEFSKEFYMEEFEKVVLAQGLHSAEEYLKAVRTGRSTRISRLKRVGIWQVFEAFRAHLRLAGWIDREDAYHAARRIIETQATQLPYEAVVVDESQDFGNEAFRLIRALSRVRAGSDEVEGSDANRLFLVGDAHQRIYGQKVVLSRCGINIRGRSSRLRINYRTSEPILKTAIFILEGVEADDLDGGSDTLRGYISLFGGPEPEFLQFDRNSDPAQEIKDVMAWIEKLRREWQYGYEDFGLVARTNRTRDLWARDLREAGMEVHCIEGRVEDSQVAGSLQMATVHRVKGLEFPAVIILDAEADQYPLRWLMKSKDNRYERGLFVQGERSLLHVAVSRAKRHLLVCAKGQFTGFLGGSPKSR